MRNLFHVPIHPDGQTPINRVRRLPTELALQDYEWDPNSGEARLEYASEEQDRAGDPPLVRYATQPSGRWHAGWRMWNGRFTTERVA